MALPPSVECGGLALDMETRHINSIDPAIKFTREEEVDHTLPMLDTLTTRNNEGRLSFSVYRKPSHTDHYLQYVSNQPLQHKLGVVKTLIHRCNTICSTEDAKIKELEHLQKVLSVSGYPRSAWTAATAAKPPPHTERQPNPDTRQFKGSVSLPYVGPVSEAVARYIRRTGIQVHMRPTNTLRAKLVHPKDKTERLEQAGVVYKIQCNDCPDLYVGETERRLNTRFKEHHRSSSPVGLHVEQRRHSIDEGSVSVLHREDDWFRRGVAEALHIQREAPTLNRGRERHTLSAIYHVFLGLPARPCRMGSSDLTALDQA